METDSRAICRLGLSGSLERVRNASIPVRLSDGRLIDAVLPKATGLSADAIAADFNLADQVQIGCRPIKTVYDRAAALHEHLELKDLRFLRPASPQELAQVVGTLSRQRGENLLKHVGATGAGAEPAASGDLGRIRQLNLEYSSKLPGFVADEKATRYSSDLGAKEWRLDDTSSPGLRSKTPILRASTSARTADRGTVRLTTSRACTGPPSAEG
jgi:hypothetical protein